MIFTFEKMKNGISVASNVLYDILYIVDLKHRDLPTAKRIGHNLNLHKCRVGLCNGAITFQQIIHVNPKCIIIPKRIGIL